MGYFLFTGPMAMFLAGDYDGSFEERPDRDAILRAAEEWRDSVVAQIPGCARWQEAYRVPYLTANTGPDAIGALMLRICSRIVEEECPATVERGWRFFESDVFRRAMSDNGSIPSMLIADVWVPSPAVGLLRTAGPTGGEVSVSTLGTLRKDLIAINQGIWGASDQEIASWA